MFLEYLRNQQLKFEDEIRNKKKMLSNINREIKENNKLLEVFCASSSSHFSDFTPQIISSKDKSQKETINATLKDLNKEKDIIQNQLFELEKDLNELIAASSDVKATISELKNIQSNEHKVFKQKLHHIQEIILQDPQRASIELNALIEILS